jgi:hypothetical protein
MYVSYALARTSVRLFLEMGGLLDIAYCAIHYCIVII